MLKRKIDAKLDRWRDAPGRRPLIVQGARQVGKTHSVLELGKRSFKNVIHLDLARDRTAREFFDQDIDPQRIVSLIEARLDTRVTPGETLLFFDEIQESDRALTSLKYFNEDAPEYCVVAAGSLLGVALNHQGYSFPVGKVDTLTLNPLDFEEYLWARDREQLASLVREAFETDRCFELHDSLLEIYHEYLLVGGMPAVVSARIAGDTFPRIQALQIALDNEYVVDMTKYAEPSQGIKVIAAWKSLPSQLSKENTKFMYSRILRGARASDYAVAIHWLEASGVVNACSRVGVGQAPLRMHEEPDFFKLYLHDTGLLSALLGGTPASLAATRSDKGTFRGAITENYVMQQLVASGLRPHYWGTASEHEVDFVVQGADGHVVPIEVKAGRRTRSTSLDYFREKYDIECSIRTSEKNFGFENGVKSVPLYALFALDSLAGSNGQ